MIKAVHLLALVCLVPQSTHAAKPGDQACFERLTAYAIERPRIPGSWMERPQFDVSRDGQHLIYVDRSASVTDNSITDRLWAVNLKDGLKRKLVSVLQTGRDGANLRLPDPSVSPDGTRVAVLGGKATTGITIFNISDGLPRTFNLENAAITDLHWSPDGKSLAVAIAASQAHMPRSAFQPTLDWDGASGGTLRQSLAILDASSGAIIEEVPHTFDLVSLDAAFSWSPDGTKIAFSARSSGPDTSNLPGPNIYVWNLATGGIEALSDRPGPNLDPRWSPDGKRIAYLTSDGRDLLKGGLQLIVQSSSGLDQLLVSKPDETTGSPYLPTWIDAEHLTYVAMRQMECPVFKVNAIQGTAGILGQQSLSCFGGSKVGADDSLLMTRHSLENPSEVIITAEHVWSPRPLSVQPAGPRLPWHAEAVSWQSKDGEYVINGVLIRAGGRQADRALLVSLPGGPAMVTPESYNDDAPFLPYGLLTNGFSILIPNTRGRGGYGRDFEAAIRDRKDYVQGPLEDILGGVDYATKRLGFDRSRVALAGFSYGGILTAYAASNVHAFRAAISMEGVVDFYSRALLEYGGPNQESANANMGFGNPYDIGDKERLLSQSPLLSIDALQTPVLLECGENSLGPTDCLKFFRTGNARGSAPVELAIYPRTAHQILEPALRLDSARRQLQWLRRWIPASSSESDHEGCYGLQ
ncbi:prolyl oligopeptidase family serine peptidase [Sphingobium xenophagum]